MWRCKHHRVDGGVGENLIVAFHHAKLVLPGERPSLVGRARGACDKLHEIALALDAGDEMLSPGAHADDGCADHCVVMTSVMAAPKVSVIGECRTNGDLDCALPTATS